MSRKKEMVILAYGKRWERSLSEKQRFSEVPARVDGRSGGLYILYHKEKIVYVGKSIVGLRGRIRQHATDHLKSKWDSFTWFVARKRYTSELEALLHNIFWDIKGVTLAGQRARLKGKKHVQKKEIGKWRLMKKRRRYEK